MEPKKINTRDEEWLIQQAIIRELKSRDWFVKETHGNMYQSGFPDLFCCHTRYGHRWVEVKKPKGYKFTPAQIETFPKMVACGSGIWVATTHVGIEQLVMKQCNWHMYLLNVRGVS